MRIKAVLFDWNGTVMDDVDVGCQASNHMLRYYGIPIISKEKFRKTFDVPWFIFYERNGIPREKIDLAKHQREYMKIYNSLAKKAKPRKNVRKVLKWLKKNKILVGILSFHLKEDIEKNLKKYNLGEYMNVVIGANNKEKTGTSKNKKVESALSNLEVSNEEVLYVGDMARDLSEGKKYRFQVVGITNGWQSKDKLVKAKPDYLIKDMIELIKIIKKLNER